MPRYFKLRDGCDWMWSDVEKPEEMIESFARSIQREDSKHRTVEEIAADIRVFRFHENDSRAGEVSRLEHTTLSGHRWVAQRKFAQPEAPRLPVLAGGSYPSTCPRCGGTGGGQYNDCPTCDGNGVV